ncbi:MAG: 3-hydroxybutyryl-CoA dehydrogenase [Acidimicrobiales bacterium]|jgi:3-hydroxybutyryl-CoA dehydrogenase
MKSIEKIIVIGAGQMGSGIAQVAAQAGLEVVLNDVTSELAERGLAAITKNLDRDVDKGRITESDKAEALRKLSLSISLDDAKDIDLAVEAAVENMEVKRKIFRELDRVAPLEAVLASNTSSLPITEIAALTRRPGQVIGLHFMNPVPVMKLVEVIRGLQTDEETYKAACEVATRLGKTPVEVSDSPGFVVNRVLIPMINEAIYCVYEGVSTPAGVDEVMKLGANHPMGPLALADFIGLDTCLAIMEVLYEGLGDSKYRPCPLLRKYVRAGWLGRKSGQGFFTYGH